MEALGSTTVFVLLSGSFFEEWASEKEADGTRRVNQFSGLLRSPFQLLL